MDFPSPHSQTVFEAIGGAAPLRVLVDAFYDRMDADPAFALLRSLHPASLAPARDRLYWFLSGWSGGPELYSERFGHPRLRQRHLHVSIGVAERDQWLACMAAAMQQCALPAPLQQRLQRALFQAADWMRNRPEGPAAAEAQR